MAPPSAAVVGVACSMFDNLNLTADSYYPYYWNEFRGRAIGFIFGRA